MSRRQALAKVDPAADTHAGLWLERYLADLEATGGKQAHIEQTISTLRVPAGYSSFYKRWKEEVAALPPCTLLAEADALGRVVVGLGAESVLETAVTLHRTYGVPSLPGPALKGLAAAAAHKSLEDPAWRKAAGDAKAGESHRLMFGDTESSGYVTFHDALWIPAGDRLALDLDVMTVHHPEYYQGKGSPPADWDSPIPVAFVSARGKYLLALTGPREWAQAALEILTGALEHDGIGAKTAAGYGRMKVAPLAERQSSGRGSRMVSARSSWEAWVRGIGPGAAETEVPRVLRELTGEDRRLAAQMLVKNLTRRYLNDPKHRDKEWVQALLAAADS